MNYLLWVDLETSGLDSQCCSIIEAAWSVTPYLHKDMAQHPAVHSNVIFADELTYWQDKAKEMHKASGLYNLCRLMGNVEEGVQSLRVVEAKINDALNAVTTNDNVFYLAGSSIHFDRSFLNVHMPGVASRLHYRLFDVSAQKMLMESMGFSFEGLTHKPHRAAADLRNSYELYQKIVKLRYQAGLLHG